MKEKPPALQRFCTICWVMLMLFVVITSGILTTLLHVHMEYIECTTKVSPLLCEKPEIVEGLRKWAPFLLLLGL